MPKVRKRRARKMKEPLDPDFRRRSKRLNPDIGGFRNKESEAKAADFPTIYTGSADNASNAPAPHLSATLMEGIAVNYLQMQPGAVSAAILDELDD
ncbi:unnamed protein product [Urochloa humidicola]